MVGASGAFGSTAPTSESPASRRYGRPEKALSRPNAASRRTTGKQPLGPPISRGTHEARSDNRRGTRAHQPQHVAAVVTLLEGGLLYGPHDEARKIIALAKSAQQRLLREYDRARATAGRAALEQGQ